ncbi:uncharacterized protein E0L32_007944 [Thyridium curvatum]|uniref:Uncharacterized protein n=1 Tax=Thyridium curvatum TaxID=1093900 RepID=A0A507ATL7_9PEZI|nr:uncharacterized protein E0L32_007944 [Thyridium curvatum]TPX11083.1 hypothetical protein E0L32_007944 [Thyridium curvatum]
MLGFARTLSCLLALTAATFQAQAQESGGNPSLVVRKDYIHPLVTPVNGGIYRPETEVFHPLVTRVPEPSPPHFRRDEEGARKGKGKNDRVNAPDSAAAAAAAPAPPPPDKSGKISLHYSPMFIEMPPGFKVTPKQIVNWMVVGNRTLINADRLITITPGVGVTFTGYDRTIQGRLLPMLHQMLLDKAANSCGLAGYTAGAGAKGQGAERTWQLMSAVGLRATDHDGKVVAQIGYELVDPDAKDDGDEQPAAEGDASGNKGEKKKADPAGWEKGSKNWHKMCLWSKIVPDGIKVLHTDGTMWLKALDKYRGWNEHFGQEHYAREIDKLMWEGEKKRIPIHPDLRDRLLDGRGIPSLSEAEIDSPQDLEQSSFEEIMSRLSADDEERERMRTSTSTGPPGGGGRGGPPTDAPDGHDQGYDADDSGASTPEEEQELARARQEDGAMALRQARCRWFDNSGNWEQMIPTIQEEERIETDQGVHILPTIPEGDEPPREELDELRRIPPPRNNLPRLRSSGVSGAERLRSSVKFRRALDLAARDDDKDSINGGPDAAPAENATLLLTRAMAHAQLLGAAVASLPAAVNDSATHPELAALKDLTAQLQGALSLSGALDGTPSADDTLSLLYIPYFTWRHNLRRTDPEKYERIQALRRQSKEAVRRAKSEQRGERWEHHRGLLSAKWERVMAARERRKAAKAAHKADEPPYAWRGPKPPVHMPEELVEQEEWRPHVGEPCCGGEAPTDHDETTQQLQKLYDDLLAVDHPKDGHRRTKLFHASFWESTVDPKWAPKQAASDVHKAIGAIDHIWKYAKWGVGQVEMVRSLTCDYHFSPGHSKARRQLGAGDGEEEERSVDFEGWCAANLSPSEDLFTGEIMPPAE